MSDLKHRQILVLGGSGQLGSRLVTALASRGAVVLATATTLENAARIPTPASVRLLLDLNSQESIDVLAQYLIETDTQIDGIVNAAGVVAFGPIQDLESDKLEQLFRVNSIGPISLISKLLPALKISGAADKAPFIVTISGVVAEQPMAGLAAYSASKSALFGFTQAIGRELRRDGIRVLDARPGHTETGLASRAISGVSPNFPTGMNPDDVVARIIQAIEGDEKDLASGAFSG